MVSTTQLLDFLQSVENEVAGTASGPASKIAELESEKVTRTPAPVDGTLRPLHQRLDEAGQKIRGIEQKLREKSVSISKNTIRSISETSDAPEAQFNQAIARIKELSAKLEHNLEVAQQTAVAVEQDRLGRIARMPVYGIAGCIVLFALSVGDFSVFKLVGLVVPAVALGAVELRARNNGCLSAIGRLLYILIGGLCFLGSGVITLVSVAELTRVCRGLCFSGLYQMMLPLAAVMFLLAGRMLWVGIWNKLPYRAG